MIVADIPTDPVFLPYYWLHAIVDRVIRMDMRR